MGTESNLTDTQQVLLFFNILAFASYFLMNLQLMNREFFLKYWFAANPMLPETGAEDKLFHDTLPSYAQTRMNRIRCRSVISILLAICFVAVNSTLAIWMRLDNEPNLLEFISFVIPVGVVVTNLCDRFTYVVWG